MPANEDLERGIQALLDGRQLELLAGSDQPSPFHDAMRVVDAIARVHRVAVLGSDTGPGLATAGTWGHLEIRSEIGRGASGTVYRAWDTRLAREVALKLQAGDAGDGEALDEGRLLAQLNHPHIVRVYGADSHDGVTGLWMELLHGETLEEIVTRDGVLGTVETLMAGIDLSGALAAVHAAGLLHRDVKARNVFRERGGRVVLLDLGAGRTAHACAADRRVAIGTPMYMAPEVLAGGSATVSSDLYCLGVLLFRLRTGFYPVQGDSLSSLRASHASAQRASLRTLRPDVPAALATIIDRACHENPRQRYASAAEMEAALRTGLEASLTARATVATPIARRLASARRSIAVAGAVAALSLAIGAGGWESTGGRGLRRQAGLAVLPRSPMYISLNGGLAIVRPGGLQFHAYNPGVASVIAVSSDLGARTTSGAPPWIPGAAFDLEGIPASDVMSSGVGLCCFSDGTTDGRYNYSARTDSTLLAPIGSRPLAQSAVYRFARDWSDPQPLFTLSREGAYGGIAYDRESGTFWLTHVGRTSTDIEEWSADGQLLSSPVSVARQLGALALDPADGTLWTWRSENFASALHLENFTRAGRHLGAVDVRHFTSHFGPVGAEFVWNAGR